MNITIFGSATPQPNSPAYQEAQRLGQLLAQAGHVVLTGGYIGTMEAVSRGAAEAGGHVIGVTCAEIEAWRPVRANPWVKEEWRCQTLQERLDKLITGGEAALALPGGVGTLVEIALTWNRLIIAAIPARPLILIGQGWQTTFTTFIESMPGYIAAHDQAKIQYVATVEEAVAALT
jgi:uncharacterized protein (TIGR00730 family)